MSSEEISKVILWIDDRVFNGKLSPFISARGYSHSKILIGKHGWKIVLLTFFHSNIKRLMSNFD
jgi:hypothetical protein